MIKTYIHHQLRQIGRSYDNLQCQACADEMEMWLSQNGFAGIYLTARGGGRRGYIVSARYKSGRVAISENGYHYGIEVGGLVFDNLPEAGLTREVWLNGLDALGGVRIIEQRKF